MVIPEKIKVGGYEYPVRFIKNMGVDRGEYGSINHSVGFIEIDDSITGQTKESTFIHEALHALDNVYDIGLNEHQVAQMEAAIYAFLKDNPIILGGIK